MTIVNKIIERKCTCCGETKPLDAFPPNKGMILGVGSNCRVCANAITRKWQRVNRGHIQDLRLQRVFGITLDVYNLLLERQGGVCAICGAAKRGDRNLVVDHDHDTGSVRGLLCGRCNMGIGLLDNSVEHLRAAADYLETCLAQPSVA